MKRNHLAWGIEGLSFNKGPWSLIGVGWFPDMASWHRYAGHNVMLWPTRREARAALHRVKGPSHRGLFRRARVVRVIVTLKVP